MKLDLQYKINADYKQKKFLRENSTWYKYLNRHPNYYKNFLDDMKDKYKLKPTDKLAKAVDNINMINSFLEVLK